MDDTIRTQVIFDRLAGALLEYVKNYYIVNSSNKTSKLSLEPSYVVDYTIYNVERFDVCPTGYDWWAFKIASCYNINDLPEDIKQLVVSFLPRFFNKFPKYENEECLKLRHHNCS